MLSSALQNAIENEIEKIDTRQLKKGREELTDRYRRHSSSQFMYTEAQRQAYIFSRMPATHAALMATFKAIRERGSWEIKSLLDLGAGPGTAMWAACENFPSIERVTLVEKDPEIAAIGKRLASRSENQAIDSAKWLEADLEQLQELPPHDLVIFSYSIGELKKEAMLAILKLCWPQAEKLLVIVEPGTPHGFENIRLIRSQLVDWGASLVAPCPHQLACPMAGGDWCHFAGRVERSSLHRQLKGGSLSYEDEKFSYIAVAKEPASLPKGRILTRPLRHSGHTVLKLCTSNGVQQTTVSKKMGEVYKAVRKAEWGDIF